jgi:hypothetical protein
MNYSVDCYANFYIPLFLPLLQISVEDLVCCHAVLLGEKYLIFGRIIPPSSLGSRSPRLTH